MEKLYNFNSSTRQGLTEAVERWDFETIARLTVEGMK